MQILCVEIENKIIIINVVRMFRYLLIFFLCYFQHSIITISLNMWLLILSLKCKYVCAVNFTYVQFYSSILLLYYLYAVEVEIIESTKWFSSTSVKKTFFLPFSYLQLCTWSDFSSFFSFSFRTFSNSNFISINFYSFCCFFFIFFFCHSIFVKLLIFLIWVSGVRLTFD